jgi:putative DNA primase/helicase
VGPPSSRAQLVAAGLTVLRGYSAAGRPDMRLPPWGSFEGWSKLVRGALVWAGEADPGETRE